MVPFVHIEAKLGHEDMLGMDGAMKWKLNKIWPYSITEINCFKQCIELTNVQMKRAHIKPTEINHCLSRHYNPKFWNRVHDIFISCRDIQYNKNCWYK